MASLDLAEKEKMYEEMFSYRYTDKDPDYVETISHSIPPSPCVLGYYTRSKGGYDKRDSKDQRGRGRHGNWYQGQGHRNYRNQGNGQRDYQQRDVRYRDYNEGQGYRDYQSQRHRNYQHQSYRDPDERHDDQGHDNRHR